MQIEKSTLEKLDNSVVGKQNSKIPDENGIMQDVERDVCFYEFADFISNEVKEDTLNINDFITKYKPTNKYLVGLIDILEIDNKEEILKKITLFYISKFFKDSNVKKITNKEEVKDTKIIELLTKSLTSTLSIQEQEKLDVFTAKILMLEYVFSQKIMKYSDSYINKREEKLSSEQTSYRLITTILKNIKFFIICNEKKDRITALLMICYFLNDYLLLQLRFNKEIVSLLSDKGISKNSSKILKIRQKNSSDFNEDANRHIAHFIQPN